MQTIAKMQDGGITDVVTDREHSPGCQTCDYGSNYVNIIKITLTGRSIQADVSKMYE